MTGTFLTADELRELTGSAYRAKQVAWFADRGWTFETTLDGRPVVLRAYAEKRLGLKDTKTRRPEPDFSAL